MPGREGRISHRRNEGFIPQHIIRSCTIEQWFQQLIAQHDVAEKVELAATFCIGNCQQGVCVTVDEEFFSVSPETVEEFFTENVLKKI